jgi:protein gp37
MSETTNISWTDATWNPWRGCTKVSAGCANCYAETMSRRNPAVLGVWGPGKPRVRAVPATFNVPLKWNKKPWVCDCGGVMEKNTPICTKCCCFTRNIHRRRVFSLSLGDWLDPEVPAEWLADMLDVIRRCPDLDFLLLTKRPELWDVAIMRVVDSLPATSDLKLWAFGWMHETAIPHNIWLGVTVENQEAADRRIPELLKIPAKVRFLSVEPLLEEVNLEHWLIEGGGGGIDWCIVGGESGPNRRDCGVDAIVSVAEQCQAAGVPVFVKQDCAAKPGQQGRIPAAIWNLKQLPVVHQ